MSSLKLTLLVLVAGAARLRRLCHTLLLGVCCVPTDPAGIEGKSAGVAAKGPRSRVADLSRARRVHPEQVRRWRPHVPLAHRNRPGRETEGKLSGVITVWAKSGKLTFLLLGACRLSRLAVAALFGVCCFNAEPRTR